jgi:hypothetical protein
MTDLSPAAQAILTAQAKQRCLNEWDHVNDPPCHPSDDDWNGCYQCVDRRGLAAALRAAADQAIPEYRENYPNTFDEKHRKTSVFDIRNRILAIAAELEVQ